MEESKDFQAFEACQEANRLDLVMIEVQNAQHGQLLYAAKVINRIEG